MHFLFNHMCKSAASFQCGSLTLVAVQYSVSELLGLCQLSNSYTWNVNSYDITVQ